MPYNGAGSASAAAGGSYPSSGQTLIESGKFNILVADLISMFSSAILKDGQQVATARIPFAQGIQTDSVIEKTSATGVTLDSVLLKDGRIDTTQGGDIVCSATINLETATGNVVDVTGSTGPVTAITLSQGHWRWVRFTGTPTLTNGASLVLPGAANIVAAAGDFGLFAGYAAGVVRCLSYFRAAIAPLTSTDRFPAGTAMVFNQTAAPTGWTKSATHNDKALRVVSGTVGSGGATAFTTVFGAGKVTGAKTLAVSETPAHAHPGSTASTTTRGAAGDGSSGAPINIANTDTGTNTQTVGITTVSIASQGGGGSHDHTLSLDLQYVDMIIATKD